MVSTPYSFNDDGTPVFLFLQGGAALGARSAGFVSHFLEHSEFDLKGIAGTSSGAVTAWAAITGYLHGLRKGNRATARQSSRDYIKIVWHQLSEFQSHEISKSGHALWFNTANIFFPHLPQYARDHFKAYARKLAMERPTEAPLLGFFDFMEKRGLILHPDSKVGDPQLIVNTTKFSPGQNIWEAKPTDEVAHTLNGRSQAEQHRLIAASGCLDFSLPVDINGQLMHDGAFSAAFPDPMGSAKLCNDNGWQMIIVRTRPGHAHTIGNAKDDVEEWMRAHFNTKMDQSIAVIRAAYPRLKLHVIEPEQSEERSHNILNRELSFDKPSIKSMFADGERLAGLFITETFNQITDHEKAAIASTPPGTLQKRPAYATAGLR